MRVRNKDFWDWYDNQTKHRLLQGPPPGRALQETSYSVRELTQLLAVSRDTIYALMKDGNGYLLPYSGRWAKKQCAAVPRGVLRGQNGTERKNAGGLISRDFEQNAGKPGSDGAADRACKADGVEIGRKSAWIDRRYSFALDGQ